MLNFGASKPRVGGGPGPPGPPPWIRTWSSTLILTASGFACAAWSAGTNFCPALGAFGVSSPADLPILFTTKNVFIAEMTRKINHESLTFQKIKLILTSNVRFELLCTAVGFFSSFAAATWGNDIFDSLWSTIMKANTRWTSCTSSFSNPCIGFGRIWEVLGKTRSKNMKLVWRRLNSLHNENETEAAVCQMWKISNFRTRNNKSDFD